ncbi:citryl-CoA lyase [Iodidimonas nitroreducens]|uniref:citrate synthase (unknown stereospecificity) n=1 Tax=Iodidimonas nitroreducens TaxID=1236968 RepID=A0A5A7NBS9_9PROT|nr:citryl-CoA lyase [Iodidimonas nitroreducens]GAK33125.1 citrate synthase [alpha proteobacterium Q-1]GER05075.1 citryl-CoA lyase [Iodidimonas nitroreducens]
MRIGKQDQPYSAISTSTADVITVRGLDLCEDLIGKINFADYFYFLVTGQMPNDNQRFFLNAVLVAIAEHGLVPSVQAARMTLAAAPEAWQGAVSAGLLGCGSVVLGSSEVAGQFLTRVLARQKSDDSDLDTAAKQTIEMAVSEKRKIPGIGHSHHSTGDPRANLLLKLADEKGVSGDHIAALRAISKQAKLITNRDLPVNVSGAIPAVMLDVGFPLSALKGVPLLARTASLVGHLYEETQRPIGFVLSYGASQAIDYDGPAPKEKA